MRHESTSSVHGDLDGGSSSGATSHDETARSSPQRMQQSLGPSVQWNATYDEEHLLHSHEASEEDFYPEWVKTQTSPPDAQPPAVNLRGPGPSSFGSSQGSLNISPSEYDRLGLTFDDTLGSGQTGQGQSDFLPQDDFSGPSGWPSAEETSALFASLEQANPPSLPFSHSQGAADPAWAVSQPGMDLDWDALPADPLSLAIWRSNSREDMLALMGGGTQRLEQLPEHTSADFSPSINLISPSSSTMNLPTVRSARRPSQDSLGSRRQSQHLRGASSAGSIVSPGRQPASTRRSFDTGHPYPSTRLRNEPSMRSISGSSSSGSSKGTRSRAMTSQSSRDSFHATSFMSRLESSEGQKSQPGGELPSSMVAHFQSLGLDLTQLSSSLPDVSSGHHRATQQPGITPHVTEHSFVSTSSSHLDASSLSLDDSLLAPIGHAQSRLSHSGEMDDDTPLSSPAFSANLSLGMEEATGASGSSISGSTRSSNEKGKGKAHEAPILQRRNNVTSSTSSWPRNISLRVNTGLQPPQGASPASHSPWSQNRGPSSAPLMQLSRSADHASQAASSGDSRSYGTSPGQHSDVQARAPPPPGRTLYRSRPISMDNLATGRSARGGGQPRVKYNEITAALDTLRAFLQQREKQAAREEGREERRESWSSAGLPSSSSSSSTSSSRRLRHSVGRLPPRGSVRMEGFAPPSNSSSRPLSPHGYIDEAVSRAMNREGAARQLTGRDSSDELTYSAPRLRTHQSWHRTSLPVLNSGTSREQERLDALQHLSERVKAMRRQSQREEEQERQRYQQQHHDDEGIAEEWQEYLETDESNERVYRSAAWRGSYGGHEARDR
ncbi:hypothetical protein BDZ90DRAFT_118179 [Jaminaea rosea]|uniref:Uncharacterized protein n=1 Tax=Jaminaea rosea TaxID=1569628 RepID=A0A316UXL4_9BASI|nr:hypothetical protein BDZ90DRAFT_118179 [Jaminaea rosea]PWN29734.1 hypothetical protein BDZ90DRAFT_118179 [Jaminaea rosea]